MKLRVFIASSSEGGSAAIEIRNLLNKRGSIGAKVWTEGTFELSQTYIESLEQELQRADFAVIVLTPDDKTDYRGKETKSPRDNVLFEAGLFMGGIGRDRCYLLSVHHTDEGPRIPTDLLGVESAHGKLTDLKEASALISKRINHLGPRWKLDENDIQERNLVRRFCLRVEGAWWERIISTDEIALAFFEIEPLTATDTVRMWGDAYDSAGKLVARWKSVAASLRESQGTIFYSWEGWHPVSAPGLPFKGFGELEFKGDGEILSHGTGRFADLQLGSPKNTKWKSVELRRIVRESDLEIMREGSDREQSHVVAEALEQW